MSRKPPKLVPIEGKANSTSHSTNPPNRMPSLKHGIVTNNAGSSTRRSTPTRHFLNCNGSGRRRFPTKLSPPSSNLTSESVNSSSENVTTANGCSSSDETCTTKTSLANNVKTVNGTICNGVTSTNTKEVSRIGRKSKLPEKDKDCSTTSDSLNSSVTNGNNDTETSNNIVSSSSHISNNNSNNIISERRTSRFSQSQSNVGSTKKVTLCTTQETPPVEIKAKVMPDLVKRGREEDNDKNIFRSPDASDTEVEVEDDEETLETSAGPKIIRKGDTVIKSYVDEKTGKITVFEKEMKLEVCDFGSGVWYSAKVKNIDWVQQQILVHYSNWSSRFDEWISMKSNRVRASEATNVVRLQFEIEEKVEAVWPTDSKRYSATVTQVLQQDTYEVTFDDGIKIKRSANQIFKVSPSDKKPITIKNEITDSVDQEPVKAETSNVNPRKRGVRTKAPQQNSPIKETPPSIVFEDGITEAQVENPNRPLHFSVFDVPQGELGKRKRKVHDYSVLVKGRSKVERIHRKSKSEGNILVSPTTEVFESDSPEPIVPEEPPELKIEHVPVPVVRRRKGSGTGGSTESAVPVHLKTSDKTKELPKEEKELENSSSELPESPSKKKKQSLNTRSTPLPQNNVDLAKPKVAPAKADVVTPEVQAPVVNSAPRRTKSLGTVPTVNINPIPILPSIPDTSTDKGTDSGFVNEAGNAVLIGQATDGFWKCPLPNCGKNFRKDSLLKMHFKHYHPELKVTRGIANVVQMAQARTAYENEHPSDQFYWPKISTSEQQVTNQSPIVSPAVATAADLGSQVSSDEKGNTSSPSPQKRSSSKALHNSKEVNVDKTVAPATATTSVDEPMSTNSVIDSNTTIPPNESKVLGLPRLRLSRKRNFAFANYGRKRARHTTVVRKDTSPKRDKTPSAMTTMESTNKKAKVESPEVLKITADEVNSGLVVDTPNSVASVNNFTCKLHDNNDVSSDKPSSGSSGFHTEPFLVPACGESETLPLRPNRSTIGRWSKPHKRRGLMSSSIRRVGTGVLQNSINPTSLFFKKRMQYKKLIGRRGRQRKTSLLSRISSGRMRVILEALNQRAMKRKRFKATRRCRDVKVDVINCICNNKTEFGLMIQCELCLCWQHGSCFNVQSNSQLPEYYACQSCAEPKNIRHSRKNEWAISEFYKLGKLPSFPMGPNFPKEDARVMKQCTNITSNLMEVYSMIQGLKLKERICFGKPEHPQLYQWTTERPPPQEEVQKDRFQKYFKPVLRRLLLEKKSDPTYSMKLRKLADTRGKLKKYADAVESARSTIKKKLGCRAAAFLEHVCDGVLSEMIKAKRSGSDESVKHKKESADSRKLASAENAYVRLLSLKDEIIKHEYANRQVAEAAENGTRTCSNVDMPVFSTSPVKCDYGYLNKLSRQPNSTNSMIRGPYTPNGTKKDVASAMKDLYELKKYLKQKRSIDTTIRHSLARREEQFPDDWKNLMKMARGFVDEGLGDKRQEGKRTWVLTVIRTYNTLRILLKQIYSEENSVKQRNCCSEFEKTTIRLFDLFGIGLTEERLEAKKLSHPNIFTAKRIRGLETLDLVEAAVDVNNDDRKDLNLECTLRTFKTKNLSKLSTEAEEQPFKKVNISTKSSSVKDADDSHVTAGSSNGHRNENGLCNNSLDSQLEIVNRTTNDITVFNKVEFSNGLTPDMFLNSQSDHDLLAFQLSDNVQLTEAVREGANIMDEDLDEQLLNLTFETQPSTDSPSKSGIIPVPSISKITPEACKKNLVRDILLQQQQIDLYMDKIEVQIMKLSSQSRNCVDVSSMKASQLSSQRDKLMQSLELVIQLSKTVIGENDAPEPSNMDYDEDTTDSSDYDSSIDSDEDDNASNFSGTDTETADEGDDSGDDELLDV